MKVLVVEDEAHIASFVQRGLEETGFVVDVCSDGREAYTMATGQGYDAIVLDIMLPGRDGLSVLRQLRKECHDTPVVILSARSELDERLEGLNLGADDYLTKPFYVEELIARLHAVVRRTDGNSQSVLTSGALTVNLLTREVHYDGSEVILTAREFTLLAYLLRSMGRVVTRTQIYEHVWEYYFDPGTNLADVYVKRVRKKLAEAGATTVIETVRGVGYRVSDT